MDTHALVSALRTCQEFFDRSTGPLTEADSSFAPIDGTMTAAQVVAHVALSNDWFIEGAFERADGFSMDFEAIDNKAKACTSLTEARRMLAASFAKAIEVIGSKSTEELMAPLPQGPVMGGQPKLAVVSGIEDHTAHHRGALTVYTRLRGQTPPMPYAMGE